MRYRWRVVLALTGAMLVAAPGCQGVGQRRSVAVNEPALDHPMAEGDLVVEAPPQRPMTFVDRHPMLYKPRDYYETSGENPVVKAAAATLIGIPAGVLGEMRQIVVGKPQQTISY